MLFKRKNETAEQGLEQAYVNTVIDSYQELKDAVEVTSKRLNYFTTADVWAIIPYWTGGNPSVMGAVIRECIKDGTITPTGKYELSKKRSAHARPVRQYKSRVCRNKYVR